MPRKFVAYIHTYTHEHPYIHIYINIYIYYEILGGKTATAPEERTVPISETFCHLHNATVYNA